jgi:hypothetical protein
MWDTTDLDEETQINEYEIEEHILVLDKPRKRTRKPKDDKETVEYVTKEEMWNELYNYYKSMGDDYDWENQKCKRKDTFPPISNRLTNIINDIATKMGHRANFCGYSWIEEMIGDARLKMVKAVRDCSFKCYTIAEIQDISHEDDVTTIYYVDKKKKIQEKMQESSDEFFTENNKRYIKFKANPFGYFSRITSHSFLNRMKKENTLEETKRAYQTKTWDDLYSNENFRNVRRPKYIDSDENDGMFDE